MHGLKPPRQKQLEIKAIQLFEDNKKIYGFRGLSEAFIDEDIKLGLFKFRQLMRKSALQCFNPLQLPRQAYRL